MKNNIQIGTILSFRDYGKYCSINNKFHMLYEEIDEEGNSVGTFVASGLSNRNAMCAELSRWQCKSIIRNKESNARNIINHYSLNWCFIARPHQFKFTAICTNIIEESNDHFDIIELSVLTGIADFQSGKKVYLRSYVAREFVV